MGKQKSKEWISTKNREVEVVDGGVEGKRKSKEVAVDMVSNQDSGSRRF